MVPVFLIKEHDAGVPCVHLRSMFLSFLHKEPVSFCIRMFFPLFDVLNLSLKDDFPLALMGMLWNVGVLVKFHEHDLVCLSLQDVAGNPEDGKVCLRKLLNGWWKNACHVSSQITENCTILFYGLEWLKRVVR